MTAWEGFPDPDDGTDGVRCECGRFIPCRHCPTPIDPADIRPGDVFRLTHEATCEQIDKRTGDIVATNGDVFAPVTVEGVTWHLVHRPDPDAEAVEALITASGAIDEKVGRDSAADDVNRAYAHLDALREQGWDVVRRAES